MRADMRDGVQQAKDDHLSLSLSLSLCLFLSRSRATLDEKQTAMRAHTFFAFAQTAGWACLHNRRNIPR